MPSKVSGERQGGFTLIELMVVIAIMGITGAVAVVALDTDERGRSVPGYADRIAAEYSLARQRAIATQRRQRIVIEADEVSHWQSVITGLAQVADPSDPSNWEHVATHFAPQGVTVAAVGTRLHYDEDDSVPGAGTNLDIEIDVLPDGRARSATGGTFFEAGWTLFIENDDEQYRLLLYAVTGSTSIFRDW